MKRRGLWKWLSIAFSLFVATAAIGVSSIDVGYAATSGTVAGWNEAETGIKLTYGGTEANNPWTYNNSQVIGATQSEGGGCGSAKHYDTTLAIMCNQAGVLSFDYAVDFQGGTIEINNAKITSSGSFSKDVQQQDSVFVKLTSNSTSAKTTVTISNLKLEVPSVSAVVRFESNPLCDYEAYVNGSRVSLDSDVNCQTGDSVTLKFPKAISGYIFIGWKINGASCGDNDPYSFQIREIDTKIEVNAVDEKTAVFGVEQKTFYDLQFAIDYAKTTSSKLVKLHKSGQVEPKKDGSEYVMSEGVNLFIPGAITSNYLDFAKEIPLTSASTTFTCDYSLRLLAGVSILVQNGSSICVAGKLRMAQAGELSARPVDEVGEIYLAAGSTINLESGTKLYAWGFISGEGNIHARSGSTVYEGFAFCFRGGTATSNCTGKKIFPFNQYFIQNIECYLHVYYGATEKTSASITVTLLGEQTSCFTFIGANGMFVLSQNSKVIKKYDPKTDRLTMRVVGSGTLSHIVVKIKVSVDSANYVLPIVNNMDIIVQDGMVGVEQDLEFLPGATMRVDEDAVLNLGSKHKLIFYDLSNWVGQKYGYTSDAFRLPYVSPSASADFAKAQRLLNQGAKLIINGEVKCNGEIFMTKSDIENQDSSAVAKVVSDGGGKFTYIPGAYTPKTDAGVQTKQYFNNSEERNIDTTTAIFMNSNETFFIETCPMNAALVYENGFWKVQGQGTKEITITFKSADGTTVIGTKKYTIDGSGIELPNETGFAGFQGSIFLWLEESDKTRSYEPNTNITAIRDSTALIAFTGGWYKDNSKNTFYYDRTLGKIKGLRYIDDIDEEGARPENLYCFDENGRLLTGTGVFFTYAAGAKYDGGGDGNVYYVDNGVVQNNVGLTEYYALVGEIAARYYYYFGPSHYAYRNTTCYINTNLNNLLPAGVYTFGNDGRVEALECSNFTDVDSVTLSADGYCTFGTIKAGIGLFTSGTHIYYAKDDGSIMKNGTYYVEEGKLNGKAEGAGLYYFDANGYLCDSMMKPITVKAPEANA